jgi:hypothetical protein
MRNTGQFGHYRGVYFDTQNFRVPKYCRIRSGKFTFPLLFASTAEAEGLSPIGPEQSGGGAPRLDKPMSEGYRQLKMRAV